MWPNALLSLCIGLMVLPLAVGCSSPSSALPYAIEVDDEHVGPIRPDTPFDAAHIATLMPGFDVDTLSAFEAGHIQQLIRVQRHHAPVLLLSPTSDGENIASVSIDHPEITIKKRIIFGRSFSSIYRCMDPCERRDTPKQHFLQCHAPGLEHMDYIFNLPDASTPPNPDLLTLDRIIWTPHARI